MRLLLGVLVGLHAAKMRVEDGAAQLAGECTLQAEGSGHAEGSVQAVPRPYWGRAQGQEAPPSPGPRPKGEWSWGPRALARALAARLTRGPSRAKVAPCTNCDQRARNASAELDARLEAVGLPPCVSCFGRKFVDLLEARHRRLELEAAGGKLPSVRFVHAGSWLVVNGLLANGLEPAVDLARDPSTVSDEETGLMKLGPGMYFTAFYDEVGDPFGQATTDAFWLRGLNPRMSREQFPVGVVASPLHKPPTWALVSESLFYGNWWAEGDPPAPDDRHACLRQRARFITWPEFYRHDHRVAEVMSLCEAKVSALRKKYGYSRCLELTYADFEDLVKPVSGFQKGCVAEVVFNDPREMVEQELLVVNGMAENA